MADKVIARTTTGQPRRLTVRVVDVGKLAFWLADEADDRTIEALIQAAIVEIETGVPVTGEIDG